MRYLWQVPLKLDKRKLTGCLGEEPHTLLSEALRTTLLAPGCLACKESGTAPDGNQAPFSTADIRTKRRQARMSE